MIDTSEDENCNKKLIRNDAGSSQHKSYDRRKIHSLDECAENMVERLRTIPRHLNIDKKKTLDVQFDTKKIPTKHLIQITKRHKGTNAKIYVYAVTKTFGIQIKKYHRFKNVEKM